MVWCCDTLLALAGPPWIGGRGTKPCKQHGVPTPSLLWRGLPRKVGRARKRVNSTVLRYRPRFGGASLEEWQGHGTLYIAVVGKFQSQ
eukprot:1022523-Pyramimonas_sp.AAC.1